MFLSMLLGTLGASLLGNLLTGVKGMMRASEGIVRAGDGIVTAGEGSKKNQLNLLLPFNPLANIEIIEYYKMNLDLMVYSLETIYQIK